MCMSACVSVWIMSRSVCDCACLCPVCGMRMREEEQRYHSKMFSGFGSARIKGGGLFLMALYSRASRVVYRFTLDIVNKKTRFV